MGRISVSEASPAVVRGVGKGDSFMGSGSSRRIELVTKFNIIVWAKICSQADNFQRLFSSYFGVNI